MEEQNNTIGTLSKILGHYPNDRQMHDMYNSLLGNALCNFVGSEDMDLGGLLTQITALLNQQNQQVQLLVTAIKTKCTPIY